MSIITSIYCTLFSKKTKKEFCLLAKWEELCILPFHSCLTSENTDALIAVIKSNNEFDNIKSLEAIMTSINAWQEEANKGSSKRKDLVKSFQKHIQTQINKLKLTQVDQNQADQDSEEATTSSSDDSNPGLIRPNLSGTCNSSLTLPKLIDDGIIRDLDAVKERVNTGYHQLKQDYANVYQFIPNVNHPDHIFTAPEENLFDFFKIVNTIRSNIQYLQNWVTHINTADTVRPQDQLNNSAEYIDTLHNQITHVQPGFVPRLNLINMNNDGHTRRGRRFHSFVLMPFFSGFTDLNELFYTLFSYGLF